MTCSSNAHVLLAALAAATALCRMADDFYVRYYVGHKGKFGHGELTGLGDWWGVQSTGRQCGTGRYRWQAALVSVLCSPVQQPILYLPLLLQSSWSLSSGRMAR